MSARDAQALQSICALASGRRVRLLDAEAAAELLRAAETHGMTAIVASARGAVEALPEPFVAELQQHRRRAIALDLVRQGETNALFDRFANAGVPLLVMKGAALARTHYRAAGLRPRCDTDVLIRATDLAAATAVLSAAGYSEELTSGGSVIRTQAIWSRTDRLGVPHTIDLHWQISNRARYSSAFSFDELWSRSDAFDARETVRSAGASDALLLAAVHLAGHHDDIERLIWLYDVHLLVAGLEPAELAAAIARAGEKGISEVVTTTIARAAERFGTREQLKVRRQSSGSRPLTVLRDDLRCTRGYRRKLQLMREHLLPPASYMLRKYRSRTRLLLPLLYLRRLAGGVAKAVRVTSV